MSDRREGRALGLPSGQAAGGHGRRGSWGGALVACAAWPHLYLLAGDLRGAGGPGRGVQVACARYVLQQVDQQGAGVGAGVHVHHVVGAAQLEQRLALRGRGTPSAPAPPGHA